MIEPASKVQNFRLQNFEINGLYIHWDICSVVWAGSVALASAGVSVSIFNVVSKLFNIPLFSVATSFVAEDISRNAIENLSAGEFLVIGVACWFWLILSLVYGTRLM